jgi:hypothetical protein
VIQGSKGQKAVVLAQKGFPGKKEKYYRRKELKNT